MKGRMRVRHPRPARGKEPLSDRQMDGQHQEARERMSRAEEEREQVRTENHTRKQMGRGFGRAISMLGILVAVAGALTPSDVGPLGIAGVLLGVLGFALGTRRLGTAAVTLSWVEILLGVLAS